MAAIPTAALLARIRATVARGDGPAYDLLWRGHRIPICLCNPYASDAYPEGAWRVRTEFATSVVLDARECEVVPALALVTDADTPHVVEG